MPQLTLFIGKGSVGKTTVSATYAKFSSMWRLHALDLLRTPQRASSYWLLLKTLSHHRTLALACDTGAKIAEMSKDVRGLLGNFAHEISSVKALRSFTGELWRVA